jgi:DNA repair exonuclease SbcCD nuclease subunit
MRLVHTADWQMGMKAAHVGAAGARVRDARLDSARRVVELARQHDAELMLVAGDTFEDNAVDRVLVQKVADILAAFGRPVYIIPGNHDPLMPGSVWQHAAWQSHANLHVLGELAAVPIPGGTLYPSPLFEKHSRKDPTAWIVADAPGVAIGLAHGSVEGVEDLDYPIARAAAARAGLDYLALGHWHSLATYPDADGAVRMAYSGTHETTKFGERDSGHALLVEIESRGATPRLTPLDPGILRWNSLGVDIRQAGDLGRLRERIEAMTDAATTLLDLSVRGVLSPADQGELRRIEELVAARLLYGRCDFSQLLPEPSDDAWLANLPAGPLQDAARRLQAMAAEGAQRPDRAEAEVAARALIEFYAVVEEVGR